MTVREKILKILQSQPDAWISSAILTGELDRIPVGSVSSGLMRLRELGMVSIRKRKDGHGYEYQFKSDKPTTDDSARPRISRKKKRAVNGNGADEQQSKAADYLREAIDLRAKSEYLRARSDLLFDLAGVRGLK